MECRATEEVYVMLRGVLKCYVVFKKKLCDVAWCIKVLCGVEEEVYVMLRGVLKCYVGLKKKFM